MEAHPAHAPLSGWVCTPVLGDCPRGTVCGLKGASTLVEGTLSWYCNYNKQDRADSDAVRAIANLHGGSTVVMWSKLFEAHSHPEAPARKQAWVRGVLCIQGVSSTPGLCP